MPRKRTVRVRCPICKKAVKTTDAEFPFCSERCRTIDLGKWASGDYVISSPTEGCRMIQDGDLEDQEKDQ